MGLNFDTRSDGATIVELDSYTDTAVRDATVRLAPQFAESDDPLELVEAVLNEVRPIEGFEDGEEELIAEAVESYAVTA